MRIGFGRKLHAFTPSLSYVVLPMQVMACKNCLPDFCLAQAIPCRSSHCCKG